jgi:hypothetical protein
MSAATTMAGVVRASVAASLARKARVAGMADLAEPRAATAGRCLDEVARRAAESAVRTEADSWNGGWVVCIGFFLPEEFAASAAVLIA